MADLASLRWLVPGVDGGGASGVDGALAALAVTGDAGDRERVLLGVRRGIEGAVGRGAGGAVAGDAVRWAPPLLTAASDVGEGKDCRRVCLDCLTTLLAHQPSGPRRALADDVAAVSLTALAHPDPALRAAALAALAVAAPLAGPARAEGAREALRAYAADPHAGVRTAALAGAARAARRGAPLPPDAPALAAAALRDAQPGVRLAGVRLLLAAAAAAGATASRPAPPPRAVSAAAHAFTAAASLLTDADARVRVAAARALGRLASAPPAVKAGALSKKVTARTMEGKSADDAAMVTSAASGEEAWSDAAGAFVHGLEDDAAAVRCATLAAMARLGAGDPGFAAAATEFAADCVGDESGAVRAAALRCLGVLLGAAGHAVPLDAHLAAAAAGLGDSVPAAHRAAAALLGGGRARGARALAVAARALLDAAVPDAAAPPDPHAAAALATLGRSHAGQVAALAAELMHTRAGFLQRERGVDDSDHAARLALLLAAAGAHPALAALLPDHSLGAAAVLAGRWPGLGLPAGGVRVLGRGAAVVVRHGVGAAGGGGAGATDAAATQEASAASSSVRAVCASLARLASVPLARVHASLARADAALAPLAAARGLASGAAAAARLHVRALALTAAARAVLGGGLADGEALPLAPTGQAGGPLVGVDDAWPGCPFDPPPLADCTAPGARPDALEAVVAVLGSCVVGGDAACVAETSALAAVWRVLGEDGGGGGLDAAAKSAVLAAVRAGCTAPWLTDAAAACDGRALRAATSAAWPAPCLPDPCAVAALDGVLDAPGGAHARPVEATEGLPVRLTACGRVAWVGGKGGCGVPGPRPRAFLRVDSPVGPSAFMALRLDAEGVGVVAGRAATDGAESSDDGESDADVDDAQPDAALHARPSDAYSFNHAVDLLHAPSVPDCGLWACLVVDAGGAMRTRVAPGRPLRTRARAAANAHAAAG